MNLTKTHLENQGAVYLISQEANILGEIYQPNIALSCFCSPASWALSNAARLFCAKQQGELLRFQGAIDEALFSEVDTLFKDAPHGDLIINHILLMLDMFDALFEPGRIGIRILSCDYPRSPLFHHNKTVVRMTSSLGGSGERWLTQQDAVIHPLEKDQITAKISPISENRINHFYDGDIALYKGTHWQDHEELALITSSPSFLESESRLCVYIDLL